MPLVPASDDGSGTNPATGPHNHHKPGPAPHAGRWYGRDRAREQKRRIVKEFTGILISITGVKKEPVTILIEEKELEDSGKSGKLRGYP